MMESTPERPKSAPACGPFLSLELESRPDGAYAHSFRSDPGAFVVEIEMDSGFRNRPNRQRRGLAEEELHSTSSNATLTASLSEEQEQEQVPVEEGSARETVRRLLAKLAPPSFSFASRNNKQESIEEGSGYDNIKYEHLEKDFVAGIPRLAKLLDSNDSFCIFRKFGPEAQQILIRKQMEIAQVSKKLHELDVSDDANTDLKYRLASVELHDEYDKVRKDLTTEMEEKLNAYYSLRSKYEDIRALAPVPLRDHRSVQNWIAYNHPMMEGEHDLFLLHEDLVAAKRSGVASVRHENKIEEMIHYCIAARPKSRLVNFFRDKNREAKTSNQFIHYLSTERKTTVARTIFVIVAVVLTLVPVFLMFLENLRKEVMASIVAVFVLCYFGGNHRQRDERKQRILQLWWSGDFGLIERRGRQDVVIWQRFYFLVCGDRS
ncbi:hypothetical protein G7Y89_g7943 [Cudoniella acicularis]|uniref:DUF6594 domain-containing protein n=1 Tax=Cudoniella acicularis TaxID=354080 RepID=A0A8H4RHH0_9HELO|nr:hypothetical protein G7Y89_g7943 [Cudoniella acicularis]